MSVCLKSYVDSAVKNNWSAFVQSTVEVEIPWQMAHLVLGKNRAFPRKYVSLQMNTISNSYLENLMTTSGM